MKYNKLYLRSPKQPARWKIHECKYNLLEVIRFSSVSVENISDSIFFMLDYYLWTNIEGVTIIENLEKYIDNGVLCIAIFLKMCEHCTMKIEIRNGENSRESKIFKYNVSMSDMGNGSNIVINDLFKFKFQNTSLINSEMFLPHYDKFLQKSLDMYITNLIAGLQNNLKC